MKDAAAFDKKYSNKETEFMDIQVAILAGGYGTRLKGITKLTPKPMVKINNKPFLEYILDWLIKYRLRRVLLMVGYLGNKIEEYFGNGRKWGINICYSYESPPMGTAGALKKAESLLDDSFLLLNGDTFLPINYHSFAQKFIEEKIQAIIAAYDNTEQVAPNNLSFSSHYIVTQYGEKSSTHHLTHVDAGVYGFKKEIIKQLPSNKIVCLDKEIYPKLISKGQLIAYPIKQRYYDIGTPERLKTFKTAISNLKIETLTTYER